MSQDTVISSDVSSQYNDLANITQDTEISQVSPAIAKKTVQFYIAKENKPSCYRHILQLYEDIRWATSRNCLVSLEFKSGNGKLITYHCFGDDDSMAKKYCGVIQILTVLLKNMKSGKYTTKRDIYYQNVELFGNQRISNGIIDLIVDNMKIAIGSQIENADINLHPNQKGLMFYCGLGEPVLIPIQFYSIHFVDLVVIIEKDAVFKSLAAYVKQHQLFPNVLFITGKGFPDKFTKQIVKSISKPVLAFMDSDIYGLLVFLSYKYYEFSTSDQKCTKTQSFSFGGCFILDYTCGYMNITKREVSIMINKIMEIKESDLKREIQRGLFLYKKAEMNVVDKGCSGGIVDYIIGKISSYIGARNQHENIARDSNLVCSSSY